ncbi:23S rRNA (pseudouridine(1915)-N(3))-methyltransferase RlmH [Guggenheimella bovis]
MKITVIAVGKLKEKYWKEALEEYKKRLSRYVKLEIVEVSDEKTKEELTEVEAEQIKEAEGKLILSKIKPKDFVVTLQIEGKEMSSERFSETLKSFQDRDVESVVFIIGGSLGLSRSVTKKSKLPLSFGALTYPHQMMRVMLLEQIYRAFRIMHGEPYHK